MTSATGPLSEGQADLPVPAVALRRVSKRYGRGPQVLEDVTLTATAGEFLCVVGASGSGKSTLLSLLAGLEAPDAGTVERPARPPAVMFQEPALYPWLTAAQNVELALRLRGCPRSEWRPEVLRLLTLVHLPDAGGARPHQLSGGMRQRVALARALAQDSRVLLLDEPFAALDATTRAALHDELSRVWMTTGMTVVLVTHDVPEAVRLGQRVVMLASHPGRIRGSWQVAGDGATVSTPAVRSALSAEIAAALHAEVRRHAC